MSNSFSVIDIEAENWIDFILGGYYDGKNYTSFDNFTDFFDFTVRNKATVYAHNGGKYDFLFFLQEAINRGVKIEKILLVNGSVIQMKIGKATFRDSLAIMPGSLRAIAERFGLKKLEVDYENIANDSRLDEYLKMDCVVLFEVLQKFFEYVEEIFGVKPSLTIAATSMKAYRKNFCGITDWNNSIEGISREAYLGGRCEIFKMRGEDIDCYDINSMYPFVMQSMEYPEGLPRKAKSPLEQMQVISSEKLGFVGATVKCPDMEIPLLPVKLESKIIFPVGRIKGTWTLSEFRKAISLGYIVEKINYVYYYTKRSKIFSLWVDTIYKLRKESTNESERYILKLFLNSLYGKFGQRSEKEEIVFYNEGMSIEGMRHVSLELGIFSKPKIVEADYIMPQIAAHVTSYARLKLYDYLDCNSYYCDTDSVFTSNKIESSEELGGMKKEYHANKAEFFLPKIYRIETDKKTIVKAKGFPRLSSEAYDRLISKESISSERVLTFKQALIQKKGILSKSTIDRRVRNIYDKRIVHTDGNTSPHSIQSFLTEKTKRKRRR